jgi:tetrapyrrole methylase family protein/MazG family protein
MERRDRDHQLMSRIVVVGLGPGNPGLVTADTLAIIDASPVRYLRTIHHPSAHLVPNAETFDHLYESAPSFDDVYNQIVEDLVAAAELHDEVLYVVPGSPLILERSVAHLRARTDIDLVVHPAVSFLDDVWRALNIDPVETGVRLIDGHVFAQAAAGVTGPMLVAHTHANWVLSDIKLCVDDPSPDTKVVLLHHLGLPDEQIVHTTWFEMDRTLEADHLTSLYIPHIATPVAAEMAQFHELARTLRNQCPWDMEQTHTSLVRYLIEETYEVVDAISRLDINDPATDVDFIEELGDLLYQVEFHAAIAEEQGRFTMADVARTVHDKLVSRHPHVFGDVSVSSSQDVETNWENIKRAEKPERTGPFDGVVEAAPALSFATKVQQRAARIGFDWSDAEGPMKKVTEELEEVREAAQAADPESTMFEVGDLLFAVVNVARHLDIDPESALRSAVMKFRGRVEAVSGLAVTQGRDIANLTLAELDELWEVVKQHPTH